MQSNFYEELLLEMNDLMEKQLFHQMIVRLEEELSMPYVPMKYEESFRELLKQAKSGIAATTPIKKELMDEETIAALLFENSLETQLLAIEGLKQVNIRPHLPMILRYLKQPMFEETQSLLIYELIDQEIREEVSTIKDGLLIEFIPYYLELPESSEIYAACVEFLHQYVEKNPSLLQLSLQLLQIFMMKKLPLSYDVDEVEMFCASLIEYACKALNDEITWHDFVRKANIDERNLIKIAID